MNPENHVQRKEWLRYITGELTDGRQRNLLETHLYDCDVCLEIYTECIEAMATALPLPDQPDADSLTDRVLHQIAEIRAGEEREETTPPVIVDTAEENDKRSKSSRRIQKQKVRSPRRLAFIHYSIAAAATLLLMTTGIFDKMKDDVAGIRAEAQKTQHAPVSEKIMEQTFTFFDTLQAQKSKGGNSLEP
ncbi:hypothetical protein [Paenibacillus sp. FJAT-26967]|uniref:hypothetical protein n=1 Tax=Paenibacillus sp. FJAT-26967 TaxID=1729690 RepID=UPI0008399D4A|nr:hypothetical protein [Paenibacillus sp. FJAT-26967]